MKVKAIVGDYGFDCLKIVKVVVTNYGFNKPWLVTTDLTVFKK